MDRDVICFTKADSNNYSNNTHDSNNRNNSNNNNGSNNNINCNKNSGDCNDIVVMIIMHPIIVILIISGENMVSKQFEYLLYKCAKFIQCVFVC